MTALTAAMLTQMRTDIEDLMPDTCNILAGTVTSDGQGGYTETWGTATAGASCRIDKRTGREALSGGAVQTFGTWVLTLPHDTTITAEHRVEHDDATYSVVHVDIDKSWKASVRAELEEV
jgi:SPP1 family predicted phage head-tail adaptor